MRKIESEALALGKKRGHSGQRLEDFVTGYLIAHDPKNKTSDRQRRHFGHSRRHANGK